MKNRQIIFVLVVVLSCGLTFVLPREEYKSLKIVPSQLNTSAAELIWEYTGGYDLRPPVKMSSNGDYLAAGGSKMTFFNKVSPTPVWKIDLEKSYYSLAISSDGHHICAVNISQYGEILMFEYTSSTPLWSFEYLDFAKGKIMTAMSSSGNDIIAGRGYQLSLFQKSSGVPIWNYTNCDEIQSIAISGNGDYIVVGDFNSIYSLHNAGSSSSESWIYKVGTGTFYINSVDISYDGNYIVAGSSNNLVYLFNVSSSTPLWSFNTGSMVEKVVISSDGEYIAAGSHEKVYFFHRNSSTPIWTYDKGYDNRADYMYSLAISSDGKYLAVGATELLLYFNNTSSTPLWTWEVPRSPIGEDGVAMSEDGNYVAVVGGPTEASLYLIDGYKSTTADDTDNGEDGDGTDNGLDGDDSGNGGGDNVIFGYPLFAIISTISIISIVIIKKQVKM